MSMRDEFSNEELEEGDIYFGEKLDELLDNDEIDASEEAFMSGYNSA